MARDRPSVNIMCRIDSFNSEVSTRIYHMPWLGVLFES